MPVYFLKLSTFYVVIFTLTDGYYILNFTDLKKSTKTLIFNDLF